MAPDVQVGSCRVGEGLSEVGIQGQGQTEADGMSAHFTELRIAGEKTSGGG